MKLDQFLESNLRNAWLKYPSMQVYVRRGHHLIEGSIHAVLDIASCVVNEKKQKRGIFTSFVEDAEKQALNANLDGIFAESILNPVLEPFFEKRGYTRDKTSQSINYYLLF